MVCKDVLADDYEIQKIYGKTVILVHSHGGEVWFDLFNDCGVVSKIQIKIGRIFLNDHSVKTYRYVVTVKDYSFLAVLLKGAKMTLNPDKYRHEPSFYIYAFQDYIDKFLGKHNVSFFDIFSCCLGLSHQKIEITELVKVELLNYANERKFFCDKECILAN